MRRATHRYRGRHKWNSGTSNRSNTVCISAGNPFCLQRRWMRSVFALFSQCKAVPELIAYNCVRYFFKQSMKGEMLRNFIIIISVGVWLPVYAHRRFVSEYKGLVEPVLSSANPRCLKKTDMFRRRRGTHKAATSFTFKCKLLKPLSRSCVARRCSEFDSP